MNKVKSIYVDTSTIRLNRGQKHDFLEAWERAVLARMERQPGYITAWLTSSPCDDEIVITSQWESECHCKAWSRSETRMRVMAHLGSYIRQHMGNASYLIPTEGHGAAAAME